MNQLKELLKQLKDKQADSKIIPEQSDPRVRAGVEAMVRNAGPAIKDLENRYKEAVMGHVVVIGATGAGAKVFADMAVKQKCLGVDYTMIKTRFAKRLSERQRDAKFNQHSFFLLLDEIAKARIDYNMVRLPNPVNKGNAAGIIDQPLGEAVDRIIVKNYGQGLYSAISRREIGNAALAQEFSGKSLPVVLYNYAGSVDPSFLPNPVTTVDVPADVTEAFVRQVFSKVRSLVVGSNAKTTKTETQTETTTEETTDE
jgi:hypothetical protein